MHSRETGICAQRIACRDRAIVANIRATGIYIRATAADSLEIGIYIEEIGSEWWPCASTIQEMAVNIEEIGIYRRRSAVATVGWLQAAGLRPFQPETLHFPLCNHSTH